MNRRKFFFKSFGIGSVFCFTDVQARREFTWPSKSAIGSIQRQTTELITLLNGGFIINCRPGVFVLINPIKLNVDYVDIRGAQGAESTELHFINERKGGLLLRGASSVDISNIHLFWKPVDKKYRNHWGAGLMLIKSKSIKVLSSSVHGSPGAGFHFNQCDGVNTVDLFVENTLADGIHFQNSSNCNGYNLTTSNTGDDGVAIVDYRKSIKSSGFNLEKITVIGSRARGIAFVGARNGILKDFFIDKTSTNGLHIEEDLHYKTRAPENIKIYLGKIDGTGSYKPLRENTFGVNILRAKNIRLEKVEISNTKRYGYFISHSQEIKVITSIIEDAKKASIFVLNSKNVFLSGVQLLGTFAPFFVVSGVLNLYAEGVLITDRGGSKPERSVMLFYRSKLMPAKNINISGLKLRSLGGGDGKAFTIKLSGIENVRIDYSAKNRIKVLGDQKKAMIVRNVF